MKKVIRLTESDLRNIVEKVLQEQQNKNLSSKVYNLIKNLPIVRKIEKTYDQDLKRHISNLIKTIPALKGKENEIFTKAQNDTSSVEQLAQKVSGNIDKLRNPKLNEQLEASFLLVAIPTLTFLILFIRQIIYNKNHPEGNQKVEVTPKVKTIPATPQVREKSEIDKKLEVFNGKTVNFYNDPEEQVLFGTEKIYDMRFFDKSNEGGRSGIKFGIGLSIQDVDPTSEFATKLARIAGVYEIICLSNPVRLANFIVKEGQYTKDYKYNKKFTDAVSVIAGQYCKKPEADFGAVRKPGINNIA